MSNTLLAAIQGSERCNLLFTPPSRVCQLASLQVMRMAEGKTEQGSSAYEIRFHQ
ncbi:MULTISPECIES: hypothetical protein [Pseudomonas]|uniref:Uncharacterized protein n=1 Tax=Pseudomonas wuhanensis TaxID=2954098 RepID=A0ABY9GJK5_9PSED|nr:MULTISPECIES: hypothetical protein [unclassified Pseudomonas]WLI10036.1 hypothetical protein PSH65_17275 [Pseudomonas sp. FP603]WLI15839.1 hypothetical protein PSH88_15895 [Pseudomonas sp. FP607]